MKVWFVVLLVAVANVAGCDLGSDPGDDTGSARHDAPAGVNEGGAPARGGHEPSGGGSNAAAPAAGAGGGVHTDGVGGAPAGDGGSGGAATGGGAGGGGGAATGGGAGGGGGAAAGGGERGGEGRGAAAGGGEGGDGGAAAGGGEGGGGGDGPPDDGYADGVTVTDVELYQALRVPIVEGGYAASSSIPIVAGRDAIIRVYYATDAAYNGLEVTGRLLLGDGSPLEVKGVLHAVSSFDDRDSTLELAVPGARLVPGAAFRIDIVQPFEQTSGVNAEAGYPLAQGEHQPLDVKDGGDRLRIRLVPIQYQGELPDTSQAQLDLYRRRFEELYPVPLVEIGVREPFAYAGDLSVFEGWSKLLEAVAWLRWQDQAPDGVYYYGIHTAASGGLLGLGYLAGANQVWARAAIGVGSTGDLAADVAVHELGHNHGRDHAPCGGPADVDPGFPYGDGRIGVWGYSTSAEVLIDPSYGDMMSYCEPLWVSDYTYAALFERIAHVDQAAFTAPPAGAQVQTWDVVSVIAGRAEWREPRRTERPPIGEPVEVTVASATGTRRVSGHFHRYDHVDGGTLLVARAHGEPAPTELALRLDGRRIVARRGR